MHFIIIVLHVVHFEMVIKSTVLARAKSEVLRMRDFHVGLCVSDNETK